MMDSTSFRYLLAFAMQLALATCLLDVVTAYLYGELDEDIIYMKPPPDFLEAIPTLVSGKFCGSKLCKALSELKQACCAWYHHLRRFFIYQGFLCFDALPYNFALLRNSVYVIIVFYVDHINLVGIHHLPIEIEELLTSKFELKLVGRTTFYLGFPVHHLPAGGLLIYQESYTKKLFKSINMFYANPILPPMIGRSKTRDDL